MPWKQCTVRSRYATNIAKLTEAAHEFQLAKSESEKQALQQELVKVSRVVAAGEDEKKAMKEQIKSLRDLIGSASESTAEVRQLEQQLAESIGKFTDVRSCL